MSQRRAIVFNTFLETAGGGERSSFDYALALIRLGYQVEMAVARPFEADFSEIKRRFGIAETEPLGLLKFANEVLLTNYVRNNQIELFVNHTFCSCLPNPAPVGIYVVMFPHHAVPEHLEAIRSYQTVSCISGFTEQYVRHYWGQEVQTIVAPPPISKAHTEAVVRFKQKEPLILNVGRFNVSGHSKCQFEVIETFLQLRDQGLLSDAWRLVVAGHVNASRENEEYVIRCRRLAERGNVEVLTNLSFERLQYFYTRASSLWQFTGFHLPYGERPEHCEHLGLVAMDCFAYGVIPVVYERSGAAQFLEHGKTGFVFSDRSELAGIMRVLSEHRGQALHRYFYQALRAGVSEFSSERFTDSVAGMIAAGRPVAPEAGRKAPAAEFAKDVAL